MMTAPNADAASAADEGMSVAKTDDYTLGIFLILLGIAVSRLGASDFLKLAVAVPVALAIWLLILLVRTLLSRSE